MVNGIFGSVKRAGILPVFFSDPVPGFYRKIPGTLDRTENIIPQKNTFVKWKVILTYAIYELEPTRLASGSCKSEMSSRCYVISTRSHRYL